MIRVHHILRLIYDIRQCHNYLTNLNPIKYVVAMYTVSAGLTQNGQLSCQSRSGQIRYIITCQTVHSDPGGSQARPGLASAVPVIASAILPSGVYCASLNRGTQVPGSRGPAKGHWKYSISECSRRKVYHVLLLI